jgi:hypothetical protein
MKHTAKTEHRQSTHNGGGMTTPFNTILNPSTGKMVLSGGRVGSNLIKNYTADTILNPKSKKLVMTGGKVGKNVLETYKNGYLKGGDKPIGWYNDSLIKHKDETRTTYAFDVQALNKPTVKRTKKKTCVNYNDQKNLFREISDERTFQQYLRHVYINTNYNVIRTIDNLPRQYNYTVPPKEVYSHFYPRFGQIWSRNREVQRMFLHFLAEILEGGKYSLKCANQLQKLTEQDVIDYKLVEINENFEVKETNTYKQIVEPLNEFWTKLAILETDAIPKTDETFEKFEKTNVPDDVKRSFQKALTNLDLIINSNTFVQLPPPPAPSSTPHVQQAAPASAGGKKKRTYKKIKK